MRSISADLRRSRTAAIGLTAIVALLATVLLASATAAGRGEDRALRRGERARIEIDDFAFRPQTLRVRRGTRVVFANRDGTVHTATRRGIFRTGRIRPGRVATVRLRRAGVYRFHCSIHPFMRGKIVVR